MAQMMGFSTFGATQDKKRKYNPNADAATGTPAPASAAAGCPRVDGVKRGRLSGRPSAVKQTTRRRRRRRIQMRSTWTSSATLRRLQQTLWRRESRSHQAWRRRAQLACQSVHPPAVGLFASPFTEPLPSQQRHDRQPNNNDPSRGPWYEGYYDPSSNENPWARLEMAMDLPPKGTWIPRGNPSTVAAMAT